MVAALDQSRYVTSFFVQVGNWNTLFELFCLKTFSKYASRNSLSKFGFIFFSNVSLQQPQVACDLFIMIRLLVVFFPSIFSWYQL